VKQLTLLESEREKSIVRAADGTREPLSVWTVGHSTRSSEEFVALLTAHRIEALIDVRRYPTSRRYPWFGRETLSEQLSQAGILYLWLPQLGGRRQSSLSSKNTALKNRSLRGYADHMETEEFRADIERVIAFAQSFRTALMCAEAVWWRCHRSLIADYLFARGIMVIHILDRKTSAEHTLTPAAKIIGGRLSYEP